MSTLLARAPGIGSLGRRLSTVTGLGWTVLGASVAAVAVGTRVGWVEAVLGGLTGGFAFVLCAAFAIGRTTLRVSIEPRRRRLEAGRSTEVTVTVRNAAGRVMLPLALEVATAEDTRTFRLPRMSAGADPRVESFTVEAVRRGVIPVGPATSVRGDPLGLWQRRVTWTGVTEIFVHPATVRIGPLGHGLLRDLEGRATNDLSSSDLAFHTLREYVPGDDRRYIHWRSSAKAASAAQGDQFLVRQFRDTRRTHLLVVVDGDPRSYAEPDEFETAVSVGASIAVRAVDDAIDTTALVGDRWTGKDPGVRQHREQVLDMCARATSAAGFTLANLVMRGMRVAPATTSAVIVTGPHPTTAALRKVTAQLPAGVRATTVRVDPLSPARLLASPTLTVLTLRGLGDLPALMRRGDAP